MSIETIDIKLTQAIDDRLKYVKDRGDSKNAYCIRCIGVAHYVMSKLVDKFSFHQGDMPLPIPEAKQNKDTRLGYIALTIRSVNLEKLEEVRLNYAIDNTSVIAWGMECVDILNEAIMLAPVFAKSTKKTIKLDLSWLK